jgi:hypothetical protein
VHSRLTIAALLVPLAATACGSVAPPNAAPVVNKLDVARGASAQLSTDRQEAPVTVSCPNDLPEQVGATEDCTVTDFVRHERHAATVRIDRIEGPAIATTSPSERKRFPHPGTNYTLGQQSGPILVPP